MTDKRSNCSSTPLLSIDEDGNVWLDPAGVPDETRMIAHPDTGAFYEFPEGVEIPEETPIAAQHAFTQLVNAGEIVIVNPQADPKDWRYQAATGEDRGRRALRERVAPSLLAKTLGLEWVENE